LSLDGNLVAFAWSGQAETGPTDIYVKAVASEALRQLTATPDSESSPAWSPDGHSIAFVRNGNGVFTMSQLGGVERQVSASGTHVAWAGDSKSVLIRDRERDTGPFGIRQVFLDTLDRRQLTQAPVGAGDYRFEVSPDGKTLAFIRYEKVGIADVFVVPMAGGEPKRISNWNDTMYGLSWTPDGQEIVYSAGIGGGPGLWKVAASGGTPVRIPTPQFASDPVVSPTADVIAYMSITRTESAATTDIAFVDREGREALPKLPNRPGSGFANGLAAWSPDGHRLTVIEQQANSPTRVWLVEPDQKQPYTLLMEFPNGPRVSGLTWTPDGSAVIMGKHDWTSDIVLMQQD
jgi:Tol biopolymer transport system component